MSGVSPAIEGATAAQDAARDWEAVRAANDIQYAPFPPIVPPKPPEPPAWLKALGDFLRSIFEPLGQMLGLSWPVVQIVLYVLIGLCVAALLWVLLKPLFGWRPKPKAEAEPEWAPDRNQAVALLEDADRLAAEGRYGEAAHLLLQRSVHHIAEARPEWLQPASTAREIASFPLLPDRARDAFGVIATRVERAIFALRELDLSDWQAARGAYADFALQSFAAVEVRA